MTERVEPTFDLDERAMLEGWLEYHRATLLMKCEGLSTEDLRRRSVPPSTLSLLGLVRHMGSVEHWWFRNVLLAEDTKPAFHLPEQRDFEFDAVDDADPAESFAEFDKECTLAREAAAGASSLDDHARRRFQDGAPTLRWILTHMIEEYARHNGHADLLRQAIDGATGD